MKILRTSLPAALLFAASVLALSGCGETSDKTVTPASASTKRATEDSGDGRERARMAFTTTVAEQGSRSAEKTDAEVAVITTTEGELTIAFRSDRAPGTVANFKKLAKEGFYNGTSFHRIIKGFMVQGGDPLTKDKTKMGAWGSGGPGYMIKAEFNDIRHVRGVLSMARSANPDSAGSQFFICDGPAPFLDGKYTAFGRVIKGDDVLTKISDTPVTTGAGGEASLPTKRVEITSVAIIPAGVAK